MSDIHIYVRLEQFSNVVEGHGRVVEGDNAVREAYSVILSNIKSISLGGDARTILCCRGVNIITPQLLHAIAVQIEYEKTPSPVLCFHRSLVISDPNKDTVWLLQRMLKGTPCSLFIVYTDPQEQGQVVREEILNLQSSLRITLDVIKENRTMSSHEMIVLLKKEHKPTLVRERLRQLFKRGLVSRQAHGNVGGDRFFVYEPFSLLGIDLKTT